MLMTAEDELVVCVQTPMAVVIHNQKSIVGSQTAELVDLGTQTFAGALHGDQKLADFVAVALEGLADSAGFVFERDIVYWVGCCVRGLLEVVEGPGEDEDVHLGVLRFDGVSEPGHGL